MSNHNTNWAKLRKWELAQGITYPMPEITPVQVPVDAPPKPWFIQAQERAQVKPTAKPAPLAFRPCMAIVVYEPPVRIVPKPAPVETPAPYPTMIGRTVQARGVARGVVTAIEGDCYTVRCAFPGCVVHRQLSELAVIL